MNPPKAYGGHAIKEEQMKSDKDAYQHLLTLLNAPADHWDRPDCDWPGRPPQGDLTDEHVSQARQDANTAYVIGSRALRQGDVARARTWLAMACDQWHPGGAFRMAVLSLRERTPAVTLEVRSRAEQGTLKALFRAAQWGHSDAWRLVAALPRQPFPEWADASLALRSVCAAVREDAAESYEPEDPEFYDELLAYCTELGTTLQPADGLPSPLDAGGTSHRVDVDEVVEAAPAEPADTVAATGGWMWTPPTGTSSGPEHTPRQWESSLRVLDVMHLVRGAGSPVTADDVARTARVSAKEASELMAWLDENSLTSALPDGTHTSGPLLRSIDRGEDVLQQVLDRLRDDTGAAIYVSAYTDGEVSISHSAFGPDTPQVTEYAPFREFAHASAVGKSLLSQLPREARMEHLSRWRPVPLTERTITDREALFHSLDLYGPQGSHFDLLEYSDTEVCAAISVPLPGQPRCVALSLPFAERNRLVAAADTLSNRSTGLLLALVLATLHQQEAPATEESSSSSTSQASAPSGYRPGSGLYVPQSGLHLPPGFNHHLTLPDSLLIINRS
ncbi:IclR family transcriptional regulator domain-containing protein [Streptomyces gardneri]|uniref:IclR family transcriptional regulator domain-containing protein n=1 Tax=Streptomyces gardneri TaxID=66892 RepID=UPI0035D6D906